MERSRCGPSKEMSGCGLDGIREGVVNVLVAYWRS